MAGCFEFLGATKCVDGADRFNKCVLVVERDLNLEPFDAVRVLLQLQPATGRLDDEELPIIGVPSEGREVRPALPGGAAPVICRKSRVNTNFNGYT